MTILGLPVTTGRHTARQVRTMMMLSSSSDEFSIDTVASLLQSLWPFGTAVNLKWDFDTCNMGTSTHIRLSTKFASMPVKAPG